MSPERHAAGKAGTECTPCYPIIKLFSGKGRDAGWLTYALAVVLVAYFVFIRSRM